ncbi:hypothetical protein GF325_06565 [Candidatus Bathyarchaeota archaeon]|nr:hypothetical protein [Candidatus Bathyarchaeota archaeon]
MKNIEVKVLGAESMGVRSMCTVVSTPDINLMIDPGCALGPRGDYQVPHPLEFKALHQVTERILRESKKCTHMMISHYHHDHFKPRLIDEAFIHTSPGLVKELYHGKEILLKSAKAHVGKNQKNRCKHFKQSVSRVAAGITDADGLRFTFGKTIVDFSWPVFHGEKGTRLGYVIMTRVKHGDECFVHAPDVQGPVVDSTMKFFTDVPPDVLFIGGPPFYLRKSLHQFPFGRGIENAATLVTLATRVIYDHHCCRDEGNFHAFIDNIKQHAIAHGEKASEVSDAATFMNQKPAFLESMRDELYRKHPVSDNFKQWMSLEKRKRCRIAPPLQAHGESDY